MRNWLDLALACAATLEVAACAQQPPIATGPHFAPAPPEPDVVSIAYIDPVGMETVESRMDYAECGMSPAMANCMVTRGHSVDVIRLNEQPIRLRGAYWRPGLTRHWLPSPAQAELFKPPDMPLAIADQLAAGCAFQTRNEFFTCLTQQAFTVQFHYEDGAIFGFVSPGHWTLLVAPPVSIATPLPAPIPAPPAAPALAYLAPAPPTPAVASKSQSPPSAALPGSIPAATPAPQPLASPAQPMTPLPGRSPSQTSTRLKPEDVIALAHFAGQLTVASVDCRGKDNFTFCVAAKVGQRMVDDVGPLFCAHRDYVRSKVSAAHFITMSNIVKCAP